MYDGNQVDSDDRNPDHPDDDNNNEEVEPHHFKSSLEDFQLANEFIHLLCHASLDDKEECLDPETLHRLRNPLCEPPTLNADQRLSINIFLAVTNASEQTYNSVQEDLLRCYPDSGILSHHAVKKTGPRCYRCRPRHSGHVHQLVYVDNEGPTRQLVISADALVKWPFEGIETVWDVVEYVAKTHGTRDALGWRDVVKVHEEEKEINKKDKDGKDITEKKNYVGLKEAVEEVAQGLIDIGVGKDNVFNIYAATSINWQLLTHACGSVSTHIATAYDILSPAGLTHSLNELECTALFTNAALLPTLLSVLPSTPTVKYIVHDGEAGKGVVDKLHAVRADITALSVNELCKRGKKAGEGVREKVQGRRPTPETVGTVYTLLGHHLTPKDMYLAYLLLTHILEYIIELIILFVGMPTGFGGDIFGENLV
ncbi:hypothetical protein B0H14DRAFT_3515119 [Mycena olivaceomarginata]|nr:hypothetical protein B0H14DRAFT_3515119 [Mycena olivaceomarginata]